MSGTVSEQERENLITTHKKELDGRTRNHIKAIFLRDEKILALAEKFRYTHDEISYVGGEARQTWEHEELVTAHIESCWTLSAAKTPPSLCNIISAHRAICAKLL